MEEDNTLKYYNENACTYFNQTKDGDMSEAYKRFIFFLPKEAYILDFGCGSGRDSKFFIKNGYKVCAVDGSVEMCKLASSYIKQEVKCMKFEELDDINKFDGIWACSSILHVKREKLPYILNKMFLALKRDGIIYTSFKIGNKCEIIEEKYYNYITKEIFEDIITQVDENYGIIDYYENITDSSVKRPSSAWGSYLIKRIR